ncbi:prenyltransferase [Sandaracinus amylolyticus]|uniref:prenyltransferase n=1 Tax=Sandaracinus amylolyticus TaxID=927083 RepID=UPI001F0A2DED|nr:prenyltransferase [Sandaracinus amylolyticus]
MSAASSMTTRARWAFALKPASWPKLLVPMALGQAIGIDANGEVSIAGLVIGALFTVLDLVFVVLLNDWGDQEVDRVKRSMFPHSSKKTIPDGVLPAPTLLFVGGLAGFGAAMVALAGEIALDRPWLTVAAVASLGLFVAYTLPPLRLNYRGGGELLEAFGVGIALPWINAYAQSGRALPPALIVLPGFAAFALSSAVASGLADERSDRIGGKRTFTTVLGNTLARRLTNLLALAGGLVWALTAWIGARGTPTIPLVAAAASALLAWDGVRRASAAAVTDAFDAQRSYKSSLHRLVWESSIVLAVGMAIGPLLGF